jgi:propanediol dehydratase small subunit
MTEPRYPLREHAADQLQAASGRSLAAITPDTIDDLRIDDLKISAATLRAQAEVAERAGYVQLAANLVRAAELTAVPNAVVLAMYEKLRPGRSSEAELLALAEQLEHEYHAPNTAALVREGARAQSVKRRAQSVD